MRPHPIAEITSFEMQKPNLKLTQEESLRWMIRFHCEADSENARKIEKLIQRFGVNPSIISHRYFDFDESIYSFKEKHGKDIGFRMSFFYKRCNELFRKFYPNSCPAPNHIIHVTCTGYVSPSSAQIVVNENQWNDKTNITHAYHMGCYASIPGIRIGEALISARNPKDFGRVDLVHTEMCGLHMDPVDHSPEQLVVQSLFADGHIKYSLVPAGTAKSGFALLTTREQVISDSAEDMTWAPASWGMSMTLSREVPTKISPAIRPFLEKLLRSCDLSVAEVIKDAIFAIHPGGPKIIDAIQNTLELRNDQISVSRKILFDRGNMSSATLPHIWMEILNQGISPGKVVVSLAFGPGLTLFGSVFVAL